MATCYTGAVLLIGTFYPSRGRLGMRRATLAASAALITLGATGSLADRSLALPLSDPRVHDLAIAGSPIQKAWCRRWWQWHGARWVRSCWPAGYDPCGYARGCAPPNVAPPVLAPLGRAAPLSVLALLIAHGFFFAASSAAPRSGASTYPSSSGSGTSPITGR